MTTTTREAPPASERIAEACIRLAQGLRYSGVTMSELCDATGVSERRVRYAFHDCYGTAPTAYLRDAALREVRRVLLEGPPARNAVTRAASDYGFEHLSRFASQYRALFGEPPSATVIRARETAPCGFGEEEAVLPNPDSRPRQVVRT
jgi:AraC family ethanolamine operon transcriptional activator